MIIAVDHGNKQIKTASKIFTSGLLESDVKPPFGENIIKYRDSYYTLSGSRMNYMRDKTKDDRFFILTLFAIAYEIEEAGAYSDEEVIDVQLVVGLPPAHYGALYEKFEKYFIKRHDVVEFDFQGKPYSIYISEAMAFPQAYAAAMPLYSKLKDMPKAMVVDIGGFTADYIQLKNGQADLGVCDSLEYGVIRLYNSIQSRINREMDRLIEETEIDAVLMETDVDVEEEIQIIINQAAQKFINDFFDALRERMIDLQTGKTFFVGGGSILLRRQIEMSRKVGHAMFVDDISANVRGYQLLYSASKAKR